MAPKTSRFPAFRCCIGSIMMDTIHIARVTGEITLEIKRHVSFRRAKPQNPLLQFCGKSVPQPKDLIHMMPVSKRIESDN